MVEYRNSIQLRLEVVEAGGGGGYEYFDQYGENWWESRAGTNGASYSGGGSGGNRGTYRKEEQSDTWVSVLNSNPTAGSNGWVYVEYGGDI